MQQQSPQKIESASLSPDAVHVVFADGGESVFHFPWLLDNCPSGFHPETHERVFDLLSLPPDFAPKSARPADGELEVEWADGRRSRFSAAWLRENAYDDDARAARRRRPMLWDAETLPEPPRFSHPAVMTSDSARLEWLTVLRDYGVAMLEQVPDEMNAARSAAETIAFLRRTNFGEEFSVKSKPNPNNVAYTAEELQLHTDLPNREMPPGAQFLHCLQNESEGGESVFADGFRAAEILREEHPDDFALLTKWPLPVSLSRPGHRPALAGGDHRAGRGGRDSRDSLSRGADRPAGRAGERFAGAVCGLAALWRTVAPAEDANESAPAPG